MAVHRTAAIDAAVVIDQPSGVPLLDQIGDPLEFLLSPAFVKRYPDHNRGRAAMLVDQFV